MTKVAIIGAGKGGRTLLEMFAGDPPVTILGVAARNPWAPGLKGSDGFTEARSRQPREVRGGGRARPG